MWFGFTIFLIIAIFADTFLLKRVAHPNKSLRAAFIWTCVWISCALIFNLILWFYLKSTTTLAIANDKALDFFTGYLIEKSLSFDNLFVFYMIFHQFRIPVAYQQRVFSIGIISAIIMRLVLILFGTWVVSKFHWLMYIMGAFLILTGIKMFFTTHKEKDFTISKTYLWLKQHLRITSKIEDESFFIKKNAVWYATPLFVALIFIEISDLIFAFDSIPAIFAITTDPFIVWTSNIFAILGLRAMYFILAGMIGKFDLLKFGIALIMTFVGVKMIIEPFFHIPVNFSLGIIIGILLFFAGLSFVRQKRKG